MTSKKNNIIIFSQGSKYLELKNNIIKDNINEYSNLTKVNGYDIKESYNGQTLLQPHKFSADNPKIIESFSGMYKRPIKKVSIKNALELKKVKFLTAKYKEQLDKYQTAYTAYIKKTTNFTQSMPRDNKENNKLVIVNNNGKSYGSSYISDGGVVKPLKNSSLRHMIDVIKDYEYQKNQIPVLTAKEIKAVSDEADACADVADVAGCAYATSKLAMATKALATNAEDYKKSTKKLKEYKDCPLPKLHTINIPSPVWTLGTGAESMHGKPDVSYSGKGAFPKVAKGFQFDSLNTGTDGIVNPTSASTGGKYNIPDSGNLYTPGNVIDPSNQNIFIVDDWIKGKCNSKLDGSDKIYLKNLKIITASEKKIMDETYNNLIQTKKQINDSINSLIISDKNIVSELGDEVKKIKEDMNKYEKIMSNISHIELQSEDVRGMYEDSNLNVISRNTQFLAWSILAIGIVTVGIIKTNK